MRGLVRGLVRGDVPLLDFVETGEEGDRDEDDDGFLAVADFELCGLKRGFVSFYVLANSNGLCSQSTTTDAQLRWLERAHGIERGTAMSGRGPVGRIPYLTGRDELQGPQCGLHVRDVRFQVIEGICDTRLEL